MSLAPPPYRIQLIQFPLRPASVAPSPMYSPPSPSDSPQERMLKLMNDLQVLALRNRDLALWLLTLSERYVARALRDEDPWS